MYRAEPPPARVAAPPTAPAAPLVSDRLWNEDIKPVRDQSWSVYNLFAMWMSNVHSVAGYVFAASLFTLGLAGWQVFSALIVGTTLNLADFARFIESPASMRKGNFLGLPLNFTLFALAAVVTTSGGLAVFNELITDPVELVARIDNVTAVLLGALTFMIATIATNIVANFVSASMDLANLVPKRLSFRRAGLVASLLSVAVMPWKLYANPDMVQYTLGTLGSFIGPIFGIIIADYFVFRRQHIDLRPPLHDRPERQVLVRQGLQPARRRRAADGRRLLADRRARARVQRLRPRSRGSWGRRAVRCSTSPSPVVRRARCRTGRPRRSSRRRDTLSIGAPGLGTGAPTDRDTDPDRPMSSKRRSRTCT